MNKELQDLAWRSLPKEFKEEVKKYYHTLHEQCKDYDGLHLENAKAKVQERIVTLEYFFGKHNLTSDAEGEEMLTCERSKVQEQYILNVNALRKGNLTDMQTEIATKVKDTLYYLFGSKCLPDEPPLKITAAEDCIAMAKEEMGIKDEPKPAEPKFNLGDIVRFKYCCTTYRIDGFKMSDGVMLYQVGEVWAEESDLEPYTGPEENIAETRNFSQDCDKQFDNILKDSFAKERRLNIAAQMMQGLICAPLIPGVDPNPPAENLAQTAFRLADALIAEAGLNDKLKGE